jgi:hypothetical protein
MHALIELALVAAVVFFALLGLLRVARELIRPPMFLAPPDSGDDEL